MAYNFLPCNRNQAYLLPPSLKDWLPEGHLAWFVLDAVEQIDLSEFYKKYRTDGVGNSAFHPSMMAALLIYSYCTGERSSRKIEKHCQTDVAYKVVTANQYPDHSTISRFRKDNQSQLKTLFLEILRLCAEAGLVKLGTVSLDGTKIKANASLPDGLSPTELMERKLLTERGRAMYKIRGRTVEPVFGQIKDVRGFDPFMQRGIEACRGEWSLICATHNLLNLWRSGKACWN